MKNMKRPRQIITSILPHLHTSLLLLICILLSSCTTTPPGVPIETSAPDAAAIDKAYLYEMVRHLYRWYMDEDDVEKETSQEDLVFWVRELHPKLDEGDKSRFGEVILPDLGIVVTVKKTDYTIEELGAEVKSDKFKIINVSRQAVPRRKPVDYTISRNFLESLRFEARNPVG